MWIISKHIVAVTAVLSENEQQSWVLWLWNKLSLFT